MALLAGCAALGPQLPGPTEDETGLEDIAFGVRTLGPNGEFGLLSSAELARRLQAGPGPQPLSILAISSGGASGAFGAGALVGSTSQLRPEFTVVTGVSVGALLAPFAFLGSEWDAKIREIFTTGATDGMLQPRMLRAVFGSSIYSGEPLRRLIEHYADDSMLAAVAAEAARGRLLLVGTTDFTSGEPVIWDLGSVALHGGEDSKRLFRTLLLASASVPGMLPPVVVTFRSGGVLRKETHVDGGVTLPFFIAPAAEDLAQSITAGSGRPAVRIIINGPLRHVPLRTHASVLAILGRSLSAGLSHVTRSKLESTVDAVRARGLSLEYAAIPASYPLQGAFDFHARSQRALFEYAATCAQAGRLWIRVQSPSGERVVEQPPAPWDPKCPADDSFIGRFAALDN